MAVTRTRCSFRLAHLQLIDTRKRTSVASDGFRAASLAYPMAVMDRAETVTVKLGLAMRDRNFKGPFPLRGRREPACPERALPAAGSLCAVMRVAGTLAAGA